ncbi:hypothetical protein AAHE18_16G212200 [Arachis hypogaea]
MPPPFDMISKMHPPREAWRLKVRVLRLCVVPSFGNHEVPNSMEMILLDEHHHKIQATVKDDLITTFIHKLKEGDVFIIFDFKVIPNGGLVRVTRHRFRILFKCSTFVVAASSTVIPNPSLSLTSMDQILQKRIDYEYLIDFVGVLCGLKKRRDVECNGNILKVMILEVFVDGYPLHANMILPHTLKKLLVPVLFFLLFHLLHMFLSVYLSFVYIM